MDEKNLSRFYQIEAEAMMSMFKIFAFCNAVSLSLIFFAPLDNHAKRYALVVFIVVSNILTLIGSAGQIPLLKGLATDLEKANSSSSYVKEIKKSPFGFYTALITLFMVTVTVVQVIAIYHN
jgi:hypothetical protein